MLHAECAQAMIELKVLAATCQICRREKDVGHAGPVKILSQVTCTTSSKSKIKKSENKKAAMHSDDTHIPLRNLQSKVNSANAISASHHCGASIKAGPLSFVASTTLCSVRAHIRNMDLYLRQTKPTSFDIMPSKQRHANPNGR